MKKRERKPGQRLLSIKRTAKRAHSFAVLLAVRQAFIIKGFKSAFDVKHAHVRAVEKISRELMANDESIMALNRLGIYRWSVLKEVFLGLHSIEPTRGMSLIAKAVIFREFHK